MPSDINDKFTTLEEADPDIFGEASGDTSGGASGEATWSQVWHMPVLVAGIVLLLLGVYLAMPEQEPDDFPGALNAAAAYLDAHQLDEAQGKLDELTPHIGRAQPQEQARYQLLQGDLLYLRRAQDDLNLPERQRQIAGYYADAQRRGLTLDGEHLKRWALVLVAMDSFEEALERLDQLQEEDAVYRYPVVRRMIEHALAWPEPDAEQVTRLLARFERELRLETQADRRMAQSLWAAGVEAQLLLDVGEPQQAIDNLLLRMMRFKDAGAGSHLDPLQIKLAQAYQRVDRLREAQQIYRLAQQSVPEGDALHGQILVGLGEIALAQADDTRAALEHFSRANKLYRDTPSHFEALVGAADCEARLGFHLEAREHLGLAVSKLQEDPILRARQGEHLTRVIRAHYATSFENQAYERALDYLTLLQPLYGEDLPAPALVDLARTHERLGEAKLTSAQGKAAPDQAGVPGAGDEAEPLAHEMADDAPPEAAPAPGAVPGQAARRVLFQQAATHFDQAGDYYRRHARTVTIRDDQAHGDSLWQAAHCYDQAQLPDKAIDVYREFAQNRPSDPRHLAARNRLGLAYMARGQFDQAEAEFISLLQDHPQNPEVYDSLVPLARCHAELGEYDAAERVLLHVVQDHPAITPEAVQYRQALIELGRLYYRRGNYPRAIEWLEQAVARYGEGEDAAALRYRLANAYRLSVQGIDRTLEEPMPQDERQGYLQLRAQRLEEAQTRFSQAISLYEARGMDVLSRLDQEFYRNAYFYRADCAYDLRRYDAAISLYDLAARKFEKDPASLVALVQIVNAYCELGEVDKARVANQRARWQLKHIPDDAFDDPSLPMSRRHWEDWLRWSSQLDLFGPQAKR